VEAAEIRDLLDREVLSTSQTAVAFGIRMSAMSVS